MAVSIARLRRWFAAGAILACLVVIGFYFHARHRVQNALKQVPEKLNIQVQQSAQAFTISKSEQGRTLFKLQASKAVQFKRGGHVELHDVTITIYGQDASRFDQIYGKQFNYDQKSGNVTSLGEVSIDLQSNPEGVGNPDQAAPRELKDPIHLKTTNLVFNQKSGDAWTSDRVEFHAPQLNGWAVGAKYTADDSTLRLQSQITMTLSGAEGMTISADRALLTKAPRKIVFQQPRTKSATQKGRADEATLFLRENNTLDHAMANGNVVIFSAPSGAKRGTQSQIAAQKLEIIMRQGDQIGTAIFSGGAHFRQEGKEPAEGFAESASLHFGARNKVLNIRAEQNVRLVEHENSARNNAQDVEVTASAIDMFVSGGRHLSKAETSGAAEIHFLPLQSKQGDTKITASKFTASFDSAGLLSQVHGATNAHVVSAVPPKNNVAQPDRVSTSDRIDAYFRPGTGLEALLQEGKFTYTSGTRQAFAQTARYTPADQMLVLSGEPRVVDSGMETTARNVRLNRATGSGYADGDVRTTYDDVKPDPNGGLLASSDPVHITADSMTAQGPTGVATYKGNVRFWQGANMVEAPVIQFHKDQRFVIANSSSRNKVSTSLTTTDNSGKTVPVRITSDHLGYSDADRRARYEGAVTAQVQDVTLSSNQMDVFFAPAKPGTLANPNGSSALSGGPRANSTRLDKVIASGAVVLTQPNRHATGDRLTYTAAENKFVLTGGPPAIFDAEHGKVTGSSLTMFRGDDRILVEGNSTAPAVTETQVNHTR